MARNKALRAGSASCKKAQAGEDGDRSSEEHTETLRPLVTTLVTRKVVVTTLGALNEGRNDPSHITTLPITRGRNDITTPSAVKFLTPKMVGECVGYYITI